MSTTERDVPMSPSMHSIIPPTFVPPLIQNSNLLSNSRITMPSISNPPSKRSLGSQDAHSFRIHNGMTSSLTDTLISTKYCQDIMPSNLTTERHRQSVTSTSALTPEGAVGNPPRKSASMGNGRLCMPDTPEPSSLCIPTGCANSKTTMSTWLGSSQLTPMSLTNIKSSILTKPSDSALDNRMISSSPIMHTSKTSSPTTLLTPKPPDLV